MNEKVFISYDPSDRGFALDLATRLRAQGVPAWVDQINILPGADRNRAIEAALMACPYFLVVLSSRSTRSPEVNAQIHRAVDLDKQVLPILIEQTQIPFRLQRFQPLDFTAMPYQNALQLVLSRFNRGSVSKPPARTPRIMVAALAIVGLLGIGGVANAMFNPDDPVPTEIARATATREVVVEPTREVPTEEPTPIVEPTPVPEPTADPLTAVLLSAIETANNAQIAAQYRLDPNPLYASYTGEALKAQLQALDNLQADRAFAISELLSQEVESIDVSADLTTATVRVVETWITTYYETANQACRSQIPAHEVPQTIYLMYTQNGWLVYALDYDNNLQVPAPVACP